MPALLALLSLLGGCSGLLDLPDQPRVSMEATAPLEPSERQKPHERAGESRGEAGWGAGPSAPEVLGASEPDAGPSTGPEDGGLDVRLSSR